MRRSSVLAAVALLVLFADQTTKYLAVRDLTFLFERAGAQSLPERLALFYGERHLEHLRQPPIEIVPGLWRHRYAENTGAAFSLLDGLPPPLRRLFFLLVTGVAVVFVALLARRLPPERRAAHAALGALLGGALGNFVDRMTHGYVIDFVDWYVKAVPPLNFPTFNVADVGITVGAVVLLAHLAREQLKRERPERPPADPSGEPHHH
ncbi:MAG: signal peptidase II [Deltaproteobacteria bacterium]|nr:MAG: signal peptidase II [Deltaproteobacteria bacterium]